MLSRLHRHYLPLRISLSALPATARSTMPVAWSGRDALKMCWQGGCDCSFSIKKPPVKLFLSLQVRACDGLCLLFST